MCVLPPGPGSQGVLMTWLPDESMDDRQVESSRQHLHPLPLLPPHKLSPPGFFISLSLSSEISLGKVRRQSQTAKPNSFSSSVLLLRLLDLHDGLPTLF